MKFLRFAVRHILPALLIAVALFFCAYSMGIIPEDWLEKIQLFFHGELTIK